MTSSASSHLLRRVLSSGFGDRVLAELDSRLLTSPHDPVLLRRLGDACRQAGKLEQAAATYRRLLALQPDDVLLARAVAQLEGSALPPLPMWPAGFLVVRDFLPEHRVERLLSFVSESESQFVSVEGKALSNLVELGDVAAWFERMILERVPAWTEQLGEPPFQAVLEKAAITREDDGCTFPLHRDRGAGWQERVLGFVYDFHFEPRPFSGGELRLFDSNQNADAAGTFTTLTAEQNTLVVHASDCWHEVTPIRCEGAGFKAARFTFHGWIAQRRSE